MPVIPVQSSDWSELAFAVTRLCIDPKSLNRSASLHDELEGNVIAGVVKHFGLDNVQLTRREFDLVHRAVPNQLPTVDANRTEIRDAYIAGQILKTALRLAHYEPKVASIGKAQLIVMRGIKDGPHPLKISAIKTLWRRFRSVSHFPAAQFLAPKILVPAAKIVDEARALAGAGIEPLSQKLSEEEKREIATALEAAFTPILDTFSKTLAHTFAIAEKIRAFGEAFSPPGQKARDRTLLDPAIMWTVPPQFELPDVDLDYGPPLTELERSVLPKNK